MSIVQHPRRPLLTDSDIAEMLGIRFLRNRDGSLMEYPAGTEFKDGYIQPEPPKGTTMRDIANRLSSEDDLDHNVVSTS